MSLRLPALLAFGSLVLGWPLIALAAAGDGLPADARSAACPGIQEGGQERSRPATQPGREQPSIEALGPPIPPILRPPSTLTPPGYPPQLGRPTPGSIFDPGATGPGISKNEESFLDGALDPRTGWPFVFLDHFKPRPERVARLWIVSTRDCPQEMGTDPWPCLKCLHFDHQGELIEVDPNHLFAQTLDKPVFIQVQGSLTTADIALGGLLWAHSWLQKNRAMLPETVVIAFDWPSQRVYQSDVRDINEKGRRAYVAGYHLARFVQSFPPGSRICLLGQSYGGRVVPSALHLLGGGSLNSQDHDPPVCLPSLRSDLQIRAIVLAGASDHNWLDPGARLDHALHGCEGLLNLYNRRDEALLLYPWLFRCGHHRALGRVGLSNRDFVRLGPLAARYAEHDVHDILGREHTLLDAVANPVIARRMAPYLWAPDPGPTPLAAEEPAPSGISAARVGRDLRRAIRMGGTAN
jgi:hypothetical protein